VKKLKLVRTRRYPRVVIRDYKEVTLTTAEERDEALGYLLNIVNAWRALRRYEGYEVRPKNWEELSRRQEAFELVPEEGRRHLEAVQWM
jgi:hypothetical protein